MKVHDNSCEKNVLSLTSQSSSSEASEASSCHNQDSNQQSKQLATEKPSSDAHMSEQDSSSAAQQRAHNAQSQLSSRIEYHVMHVVRSFCLSL